MNTEQPKKPNKTEPQFSPEQALRASELSYRRLFETAQDGILILDAVTGRTIDANPFLTKLLGLSHSEMVGKTVGELSPFRDIASNQAMLERLQNDGYVRYEDLPLETKDGRKIAVEFVSNVYLVGDMKVIQCNIRDITKRKRTETALMESKRFLRSTLDALTAPISILDEVGNIIEVNDAWHRFARENDFIGSHGIGDNYLKVCHSVSGDFSAEASPVAVGIRAIMSGQNDEFHLEYPCHSPTQQRWFVLHATRFSGDRPLRVVVAHENITERKLAEAVSNRLAAMVEASDDAIIGNDLNGIVTSWNRGAQKVFGYPPGEMVGTSIMRLIPIERSDEENQILTKLRRGESVEHFETKRLTKAGRLIDISVTVSPIKDAAGKVIGLSKVARDITERKRVEEELLWKTAFLEAQVDSSLDGILVVDDQGRKILQNKRMSNLWKIPQSVAENKNDAAQVAFLASRTKNPQKFSDGVAHLYSHPDEVGHDEIELIEGTVLDRYSSPVRGQAGKHYGRIWAFRDISERKKLEQQFLQAQKMESIGQLAGGIAHDFNNILCAIEGNLYLAKMDSSENPTVLNCLEEISKASQRAADLIKQILTFSRTNKQDREVVKLNHVVLEALKLLRASMPASIRIQTELTETPTVLANPMAIHQVIMNLGTNARHAMREQPGTLKVEMRVTEVDADFAKLRPDLHPGPYVHLSISDTGCGMDRATIEHIFEPFFTTKDVGEGTGLGLAVVHGIMKTHYGGIFVYSQPNEGTTFHLYFPVFGAEADIVEGATAPLPRGHGEHILFVDDEETLARLGKVMLERLGYVVTYMTSPVEALTTFRAQPDEFDLVITDLTMPAMNGAQLGRQLLQIKPNLPIILASGYSGVMTVEKVRELGFSELLGKPGTGRTLGEAAHRALHPPAANT